MLARIPEEDYMGEVNGLDVVPENIPKNDWFCNQRQSLLDTLLFWEGLG